MDRYIIRRADLEKGVVALRVFFNRVFEPENVGNFAENLIFYFPGMDGRLWFIAEDRENGDIAAACTLLPWRWNMDGVPVKVAEMGIVGTGEPHRHRGLMCRLHYELMDVVRSESFDLVVIQGIPGFYDRLGFRFALPLCSHIDLPIHVVPSRGTRAISIRPATVDDIPFLAGEDELFAKANFISAFRCYEIWHYLLNEGQSTEYGSDFVILGGPSGEKSYARISRHGFGAGLIVSEVGERMSHEMFVGFLSYCRDLACRRDKPYIRLDLHPEAPLSRFAVDSGASCDETYGWQVFIPDIKKLLTIMIPILEKRLIGSPFDGYSGKVRLDFFDGDLDLVWRKGRLEDLRSGGGSGCDIHFCVHKELFPAICLGHRSWRDLRMNRPDIFPAMSNVGSRLERIGDPTGSFMDVLFPKRRSWIYEQY